MSSHPLTPGQIMGPALVTIAEDATVAHTLRLARVNQIHHLSVLSCRAREPHPLASLIREHQVLGELAEALESFSTCIQAQPTQLFPAIQQRMSSSELRLLQGELRIFDVRIERRLPRAEITGLAQELTRRYLAPGLAARAAARTGLASLVGD